MYAIYAYIDPQNHPNVGIYGSPISRVWDTCLISFHSFGLEFMDHHGSFIRCKVGVVSEPKGERTLPKGRRPGVVLGGRQSLGGPKSVQLMRGQPPGQERPRGPRRGPVRHGGHGIPHSGGSDPPSPPTTLKRTTVSSFLFLQRAVSSMDRTVFFRSG